MGDEWLLIAELNKICWRQIANENLVRDDIIIVMQDKSYPNPERGGIMNGVWGMRCGIVVIERI